MGCPRGVTLQRLTDRIVQPSPYSGLRLGFHRFGDNAGIEDGVEATDEGGLGFCNGLSKPQPARKPESPCHYV
jgi:hypothetical protein